MTHVRITLIGKPGCHLCDDALAVVERVRGEARERDGVETSLEELDILADAALARKHSEHIPVVLVNGRRHAIWRVDPERFASALGKAARRPRFGRG